MDAHERVLFLASGGDLDPVLEEIISSEGFQIGRAATLDEAALDANEPSAGEIVGVVLRSAPEDLAQAVKAVSDRLPGARILVVSTNGDTAPPDALEARVKDRVMTVGGELASPENVQRIRRFLGGEGYRWASDIGEQPAQATLLDETTQISAANQDEVRRLMRFAADLSRFTELRPMLMEALKRYLDILKCDAGSIYLWDEDSSTLVLEAAIGPEQTQRIGLRQRLGEGLAGWVAEVGESILVTDTRKVGKLRGRVCKRYANFSCLAVPITHGGQLFGVVCLTMPRAQRSFAPLDLRMAEAMAVRLAGVIRPLSVLSELRRFSERLLGAFQTSTEMVSERDAQVESLRAFHSSVLDNLPVAVIAYDKGLRIRSANQLARSLFGATGGPEASEPAAPLEQGIAIDRALWRRKLLSVIESEKRMRVHAVAFHGIEGDVMLNIQCSPLRDASHAVIGGILIAQDVTEDVAMEAKLLSAERLALIGKLAAKVAHELNNPLDGILRFLNLALRQLDNPDKAREYLEEGRRGLLRMSNILSELLTFSRSQRGGQRPAELTQVIRQSVAQFELRAKDAGITIHVDTPPDLPPSPSNEIWEVFANLIKNALDAMKDGGELTIQAAQEEHLVRVTVSDTGPGVPPDLAERIFEPFFTTKRAGIGTGLGLALCRDNLRRIGGDIRLVPSERGARFEITIPIEVQDE